MRIKELENKETAPTARWQPRSFDTFFAIVVEGGIEEFEREEGTFYIDCYRSFNVFETAEEAEKERDIRQVWLELREFARVKNLAVTSQKGYEDSDNWCCKVSGIKFKKGRDAEEAEKHFGDRLKLINL